jgi:transcriptional regulator with XRE-family HTH domain
MALLEDPKTLDQVDVQIGQNIRNIRRQWNMSQGELGDKIGVSFQQVQKYEKGANRVSCSMLLEICRAFQCNYNDILPTLQYKQNGGSPPFLVGQFVHKEGGDYIFHGDVRACYTKRSGAWRVVVENDDGLNHIFNPTQLRGRRG